MTDPRNQLSGFPLYSLIFVDDEDIVREGITSRVNWGSNGFILAGVFEDGEKALEFMKEHPVDVLLSDISMPRMDGLTLSRIASEQFPRTMVLLLTGFEDFEYARSAIRNQVKEFLLKPITAEELEEVLQRTRQELNRLRSSEKEQQNMKKQLEDSLPLLKEQLFNDLIAGRSIPEESLQELEDEWENSGGCFSILLLRLPPLSAPGSRRILKKHIRQMLQKPCPGLNPVVFSDREDNIVLLIKASTPSEMDSCAGRYISELRLSGTGRAAPAAGRGGSIRNIKNIRQSYLEALSAADHISFRTPAEGFSTAVCRSMEEIRLKPGFPETDFAAQARSLIKVLHKETLENALQILTDICRNIEESNMGSRESAEYLNRLEYLLDDFMEEIQLNKTQVPEYRNPQSGQVPAQEQTTALTLSERKKLLENRIIHIEKQVSLRRQNTLLSRVDKACSIIQERYPDKNFNLTVLCGELCLGSSQCSALFKEGTGRTFVEYLTEVRVEAAKKLLKTTDLRSYEIADRVGYRDPRYFSSIFRKITGTTTTAYRQELEEQ